MMGVKIKNLFGMWESVEGSKVLGLEKNEDGNLKDNPMLAFGEYDGSVKCEKCVELMNCGRNLDKWNRCKKRGGREDGVGMRHKKYWLACRFYKEKGV